MLVEEDIEVSDEVIPLLARGFRCGTIAPTLPSEHRFTDMNTSIIYDVRLEDLIPSCF